MDFVDRLFNYLHQLINVVDTRCQAFFISPAKDAKLQSMRVIFFSCYKGYIMWKNIFLCYLVRQYLVLLMSAQEVDSCSGAAKASSTT